MTRVVTERPPDPVVQERQWTHPSFRCDILSYDSLLQGCRLRTSPKTFWRNGWMEAVLTEVSPFPSRKRKINSWSVLEAEFISICQEWGDEALLGL